MNGFLFLESMVEPSGALRAAIVRTDPELALEELTLMNGDRLLLWGYPAGDMRYYQSGNGSLTILYGYVSEIDGAPPVLDQRQSVRILHDAISAGISTSALTQLLNCLHGSFAVFHRDSNQGFSICMSDRVASRPLWVARAEGGWAVSSHPMAIAAAIPSLEPDPGALAAFLLYGGPIQPRKSVFSGVEATTPGTITRLRASLRPEEHWYAYQHKPDPQRSIASWIDLACERLVHSASRIARQSAKPAVFFSGGVDSRLTAVALKAAGADPLLVTLGDGRNLEVKVSERAAAAIGLRQVTIFRDKHWYLPGISKAVFESGGSFAWGHAHFSRAIRDVRARFGTDVFLLGDLCEAFSKLFCSVDDQRHTMWTREEFAREIDSVRLPLYRPGNRHRTLALLNPGFRRRAEAALLEDISERYEQICDASSDPWIVADRFFRWDSVATLPTFSMFLDVRGVVAERNLMLDKDVLDLLESAPSSLRNSANLGALIIRRLNSAASKVPNSNSLLPLCWPPTAHKLSKKCKPHLGRIRRFLLGRSHRTTGAWPEKSALYGTDPVWRDYIEKLLSNTDLFPAHLFDHQQILDSWRALLSGDSTVASDLDKLINFGVMTELTRFGHDPITVRARIA
jgi:hypothetical protein